MKNKKKTTPEVINTEEVNENRIQFDDSKDFEFVQLDSSIHDQKFKTKPTTFIKDALKRFVKNKSSVVAASILGTLILMSILVPVVDRNDIKANNLVASFLPPKWFDTYNGGFMDGTGRVSNVTLDPVDGFPAADDNGNYKYRREGVVGGKDGITVSTGFADSPTKVVLDYGVGGCISLSADSDHTQDVYAYSAAFNLDLNEQYDVTFSINDDYCKNDGRVPTYEFCVFSNEFTQTDSKTRDRTGIFTIAPESSEYGVVSLQDITSAIKADPEYTNYTFSRAAVGFALKGNIDNANKTLYIDSLDLKCNSSDVYSVADSSGNSTKIGFKDATKGFSDWSCWGEVASTVSIYHSVIQVGSFTYDYYAAANCNDEADFTDSDLKSFYELGYLEKPYEWYVLGANPKMANVGDVKVPGIKYTQEECDAINTEKGYLPTSKDYLTTDKYKVEDVLYGLNDVFEIDYVYYDIETLEVAPLCLTPKGEEMCPALSAKSVTINVFDSITSIFVSKSLHCERSRYKYFYYMGYTSECAPIKYWFGTDAQGHDFFKVVFSGLLTSLELGVLASIINITIGVIWGAVAGYFGGWVDMLMERITEILGGMPFIVMMTLIVLLFGKSNFWIFLFCLCLTGWMGTAGVTRSQFYRYRGREYVLASRTLGASDWRLIFLHILPNGIGTIVTSAVLMIPGVIFSEASISYLLPGALSFQGSISFGLTLSTAQGYIQQYPYMIISSSIVMSLIMICFNLFGNGLRDAFNPSTKGAAI